MNRFINYNVIVTGGASGIGKAIVKSFIQEGANVVVADVDEDATKKLTDELSDGTRSIGKCYYYIGDMSDEFKIKSMIDYTVQSVGGIDILVNNIGLFNGKGMEAKISDWYEVFKVNVLSYFLCSKHSLTYLKKSTNACIVNIASISGVIAQPNYLLYSSTKGALINMTRCMALDLTPYNIRVNSVSPGTVWTENNAFYLNRDYGVNLEEANIHPNIGKKHPIGRIAQPIEIAKAVLFLSSTDASFITGENLMVDGGYTIV